MTELAGQATVDDAVLLDGPVPIDSQPLRDRIGVIDTLQRHQLFNRWAPLPDLADEDGESVLLAPGVFQQAEQLIALFEPLASGLIPGLAQRYTDLPLGPRLVASRRIQAQGIDLPDFADPATFTLGRALTVEKILNEVITGADTEVAAVLGPVGPAGDIITRPVADAEALADVIDWANLGVADVLLAVAQHPDRASEALAAERARPKPRKGVVDKLVPLAGEPAAPPAADPAGEVDEVQPGTRPEPSSDGVLPVATSPVPLSDGGGASARPATPAPSVPLTKYALMLSRLGSEMLTLGKLIQADLERADL